MSQSVRTAITFRISTGLLEHLKDLAKELHVSQAQIVATALEQLFKIEEEKKQRGTWFSEHGMIALYRDLEAKRRTHEL